MWKACRGTVFSRWAKCWQTPFTKSNSDRGVKKAIILPSKDSRKSYGSGYKQDANNHHRFWNDPHCHCNFFRCRLLETVGFIGTTVALCIDIQLKHCQNPSYRYEGYNRRCIFSKLAFSMPNGSEKVCYNKKAGPHNLKSAAAIFPKKPETKKVERNLDDILEDMENITINYVAETENHKGLKLLNQDDTKAYGFFKASAELGSPKALFNLGLCYETGRGVSVNLKKAAFYYKKASKKGHLFATYNLGVYYLQGLGGLRQDFSKGNKLMRKAAKCGLPEAQVYVGALYLDDKKWFEAYNMLKDAANQNNIEAKYYLGLCYENGWGVSQSETIAVELYSEAARHGHKEAMLKLGTYYEKGLGGLLPNREFAMTLYKMLADEEHIGGKDALKLLKGKLDTQWKISGIKSTYSRNIEIKETSPILHTSSSVPELRNFEIPHMKGLSISHSIQNLNILHSTVPCGLTSKLADSTFISVNYNDNPVKMYNHVEIYPKNILHLQKITQVLAVGT